MEKIRYKDESAIDNKDFKNNANVLYETFKQLAPERGFTEEENKKLRKKYNKEN